MFTSFFAFLVFTQILQAQHQKTMMFKPGEVTIVQGINAVIKADSNGLAVVMVPPKDKLSKEYQEIDLKNDDKVIMCNGKKVSTIADLEAQIEKVEIGSAISFGVKRGKEMMIVSFPKADPNTSNKMMMMTTTVDDGGGDFETSIMKDGVEYKDVVMVNVGCLLKDINEKAEVIDVLPEFAGIMKGGKLQEGDVIISVNGKKNLNSKQISNQMNSVKIGETVSIVALRDSKEITITFVMPEIHDDGGSDVIIKK